MARVKATISSLIRPFRSLYGPFCYRIKYEVSVKKLSFLNKFDFFNMTIDGKNDENKKLLLIRFKRAHNTLLNQILTVSIKKKIILLDIVKCCQVSTWKKTNLL